MLKRTGKADYSARFNDFVIVYQSLDGLTASRHTHPGDELFIQLQGETELRFNSTTSGAAVDSQKTGSSGRGSRACKLRHGEMLYLPSGCVHEMLESSGQVVERLILLFDRNVIGRDVTASLEPVVMPTQQILAETLLFMLERPNREIATALARSVPLLACEILRPALARLSQGTGGPWNGVDAEDPRLEAALTLWQKPEWEERGVADLAHAVNISPKTLTRLFQAHFGVSPVAWRNRRRLEESCRLLRDTEMRILDVSYESGFGSLSRFLEAFRAQFGISPSEYRRQNGRQQGGAL